MLDRRNPDAAAHQRGGISHALDRTDVGAKFEVVEIHATEDDALSGGAGRIRIVAVWPV